MRESFAGPHLRNRLAEEVEYALPQLLQGEPLDGCPQGILALLIPCAWNFSLPEVDLSSLRVLFQQLKWHVHVIGRLRQSC